MEGGRRAQEDVAAVTHAWEQQGREWGSHAWDGGTAIPVSGGEQGAGAAAAAGGKGAKGTEAWKAAMCDVWDGGRRCGTAPCSEGRRRRRSGCGAAPWSEGRRRRSGAGEVRRHVRRGGGERVRCAAAPCSEWVGERSGGERGVCDVR